MVSLSWSCGLWLLRLSKLIFLSSEPLGVTPPILQWRQAQVQWEGSSVGKGPGDGEARELSG